MRKLSADFILHPKGELVKNYTLILNDDESVADLVEGVLNDAEIYDGVLCPGFINTHCHLELSYLYKTISPGKGLTGFIGDFVKARKPDDNNSKEASIIADAIMWKNGIQAVGDICNGAVTFNIKAYSPIRYHNFIEIFNLHPAQAEHTFRTGVELLLSAYQLKLQASIVPHAPYTVPEALHSRIREHCSTNHSLWSIHNQETFSENELFENGTGKMADFFLEMGFNLDWIHNEGKNSLQTTSEFFPENSNLLLVHNTFISEHDIEYLKSKNIFSRTWFALCPKANLYIENRLADIPMLRNKGCNLTIGTDSLASNDTLSILEEIKTIHNAFPQIPIENLLTWATKNGADYFGWHDLGRFEKGANPGVVHITEASNKSIAKGSISKRVC